MIGNPDRAQALVSSPAQPIPGIGGLGASLCFSCRKCSGGCPVVEDMDIAPHQIIGMVGAGLEREVVGSSAIWLCTGCQTCTTRCPNGVDVAGVIEALKQRAAAAGIKPGDRKVVAFHRAFLESVRARGRVHELALMTRYAAKTRRPPEGLRLGVTMLRKGRLPLLPPGKTATGEIRQLFEQAKGEGR
jgi:heterodisulfide reductase subunit C